MKHMLALTENWFNWLHRFLVLRQVLIWMHIQLPVEKWIAYKKPVFTEAGKVYVHAPVFHWEIESIIFITGICFLSVPQNQFSTLFCTGNTDMLSNTWSACPMWDLVTVSVIDWRAANIYWRQKNKPRA